MDMLLLRKVLSGAVLLTVLPLLHAAQLPAAVPVRSLAAEYSSMEAGRPAFVHTPYATGTGFLLSGSAEVLTARHTLLTPSGALSENIGIGVSEPPLDNLVEANAVPVAQDLSRDLVLLRLLPDEHTSAEKNPALKLPDHAALPPPVVITGQAVPRKVAVRVRRKPRVRRERPPTPAQAKSSAPIHVVWDGPAVHAAAPSPAVTAMVHKPTLHIVQDGPLTRH